MRQPGVEITIIIFALAVVTMGGCGRQPTEHPTANATEQGTQLEAQPHEENRMPALKPIAEAYVKLVLAVGLHDADYVDAYYGPDEWRLQAGMDPPTLVEIRRRADELIAQLEELNTDAAPELADIANSANIERLRWRYLRTQLNALRSRVELLQGTKMSFDEESKALYDAIAPSHPDEYYEAILAELEPLLPGDGPLSERYATFRQAFVIPPAKLDAVFTAAISACRERTLAHLELPADESFEVEYVTGKSWSAYNWYKGGFHSLIQVNTDLPIYIDRAVDLACHEGYPGHHVYNLLLEKHLMRDRGWVEFSVYPLFSPQSLIAEGTANYGISIAFPGSERVEFERSVLFPLAGLEPGEAERYDRVQEAMNRLSYAGNEAARRYLNGDIDDREAAELLIRFTMMTPERAAQRVRFIDQYGAYVINYNLGQDLVQHYVEAAAPTAAERWQVFGDLLQSPRLPSGL